MFDMSDDVMELDASHECFKGSKYENAGDFFLRVKRLPEERLLEITVANTKQIQGEDVQDNRGSITDVFVESVESWTKFNGPEPLTCDEKTKREFAHKHFAFAQAVALLSIMGRGVIVPEEELEN